MIWFSLAATVLSIAAWEAGDMWKSGFCAGAALCIGWQAFVEAVRIKNEDKP